MKHLGLILQCCGFVPCLWYVHPCNGVRCYPGPKRRLGVGSI